MDLLPLADLPAWAASIVTSVLVVWWALRLVHAQQRAVLADIVAMRSRHREELAERDARIDRLEAEAVELCHHIRRCEEEAIVLKRRIAELERALGR